MQKTRIQEKTYRQLGTIIAMLQFGFGTVLPGGKECSSCLQNEGKIPVFFMENKRILKIKGKRNPNMGLLYE